MRILYVEDNKVNLMLVERVAMMGGHEVVNRTSGEAALKDFDDINPDLILMDIQLEGEMTGLDAVRELRGRSVELPIIALTAYAMKGDREKALAAGCNDYMPKPLPINVLVELLKKQEAEQARQAVLEKVSTQSSNAVTTGAMPSASTKTSTEQSATQTTSEQKPAASVPQQTKAAEKEEKPAPVATPPAEKAIASQSDTTAAVQEEKPAPVATPPAEKATVSETETQSAARTPASASDKKDTPPAKEDSSGADVKDIKQEQTG